MQRVLLLSDGEATDGVTDLEGLRGVARRVRDAGATMSTVGVDVDYDEAVMGALALVAGGRHHFAQHAHQLGPVFDAELASLQATLASEVELRVRLAPGVRVERVFDRDANRSGEGLVVPIGAVAPGQRNTFLVQLRVPPRRGDEVPIAQVSLRYRDLAAERPVRDRRAVTAALTDDPAEASSLDPEVVARLSRSVSVDGVRRAGERSRAGDFDAARRILDETAAELRGHREAALARADAETRARILTELDLQRRSVDDARAALAAPGLRAPRGSAAHRRAQRQVAVQQHISGELLDPY